MITVKVKRNDNAEIVSFTMSGHADSGPYGYDLVCAGASAVSIGAVNAVISLCQVDPEIEMGENGGFLRCTVPMDVERATFEKVQLLFEAMLVSLRSIAEEYSEHIEIDDKYGR